MSNPCENSSPNLDVQNHENAPFIFSSESILSWNPFISLSAGHLNEKCESTTEFHAYTHHKQAGMKMIDGL